MISQLLETPSCMGKAGHTSVTDRRHQVMRGDPVWLTEVRLSHRCAKVRRQSPCSPSSLIVVSPFICFSSLWSVMGQIDSLLWKITPYTFGLFLIIPDVSCAVPTGIPNGFITFAVMRQHGYKEKVKYACNDHYVLDGEAEIQCQNTGNWSSKPVCRGESWENQIL